MPGIVLAVGMLTDYILNPHASNLLYHILFNSENGQVVPYFSHGLAYGNSSRVVIAMTLILFSTKKLIIM